MRRVVEPEVKVACHVAEQTCRKEQVCQEYGRRGSATDQENNGLGHQCMLVVSK